MSRRIRRLVLGSIPVLLATLAFAGGCSSTSATGTHDDRICAAGQYGVCVCRNGGTGTKLCHDDGMGFDPCTLNKTDVCPFGELPLDDAGNPLPDEDGGPGTTSCPGMELSVAAGAPLKISGDTTASSSRYGGEAGGACAAGDNTNEGIYQLTVAEDGKLTVKMTPLGFDANVYMRSGACASGAQIRCANSSNAAGVAETLTQNVLGGEPYWLFADGASGGKGAYTLDISLAPGPFCGDGKINQPFESCDDKNNAPDDGCGSGCKPEGNPPSGGVCPGMQVVVWGTESTGVSVTGQTTAGYASSFGRLAGACVAGGSTSAGGNAPDRVYAVTAKKTGTLTVTTSNAAFDHQLYARNTCNTQDSEIICASAVAGNGGETLVFSVVDGTTYHVIVDGLVSAQGAYDVNFKIN